MSGVKNGVITSHRFTVLYGRENVIEEKIIRNRINFNDDFWTNCMFEFKCY